MFEDNLKERYGLAIDRIAEIKENSEIEDARTGSVFYVHGRISFTCG